MPSSVTSALSSISNSGLLKDATTLASAGGTAYNLYNQYQQQKYQSYLRDLAQNPEKMNALAQKYIQPLNAGLTTSVGNQAQAYLAQRGLSDSPQISQQVEAQAIAPYIQQNQQAGYQDALAALGLGGGAINPAFQQQSGMDGLAKAFAQLQSLGKGGGIDPAIFSQLLQSGTVQPVAISDPGFTPDYAASLLASDYGPTVSV